MHIPFHKPYIGNEEIDAVVEVLRSGWLTMGKKTIEFEEKFSRYVGCRNAVAVNSATSALHLALLVAGVGKGDEVIAPADTFVATAEAVMYLGAVPVLADVEREAHCLDVRDCEKRISPKTKAIIPVHFAGMPCDMDPIVKLARDRNIAVIEDAAHSLPARYKGRMIGTIGDITCFSFYATKTITTGEGGMLATEQDDWADRFRNLRLHGIGKDSWNRYSDEGSWAYDVTELGYKYNPTDIASALGCVQLARCEWMLGERARISRRYSEAFSGVDGLIPYAQIPGRDCAWYLYPLKLDLEALRLSRDRFIIELKEKGIGTSVHFIPLYHFTYYKQLGYAAASYPESEWVFERVLSLPIFPGMSDEDVSYVIEGVTDVARKHKR